MNSKLLAAYDIKKEEGQEIILLLSHIQILINVKSNMTKANSSSRNSPSSNKNKYGKGIY